MNYIQNNFISKASADYSKLISNLQTCCEADIVLGDCCNEPQTEIKQNGSYHDMCVICGACRDKMNRHLSLCHSKLTDLAEK